VNKRFRVVLVIALLVAGSVVSAQETARRVPAEPCERLSIERLQELAQGIDEARRELARRGEVYTAASAAVTSQVVARLARAGVTGDEVMLRYDPKDGPNGSFFYEARK